MTIKSSFLISLVLFFLQINVYGQITYSTNGTGGWIRSPLTGGCSNITDHPLRSPIAGTSTCQIILEINHTISRANLNLGSFVTVKVNPTGVLNITNSISVSGNTNSNLIVDGGQINISNQLILQSNAVLNINNTNSGKLNVLGLIEGLKIGRDAILNISGDGSNDNELRVKSIDLAQSTTINIFEGGSLINEGLTDYTGNFTKINVYGFFRTASVLIRGGRQNQLNTYGDANVIIDGDLDVRGDTAITFGGNSEIDIGGNILAVGSAEVIATSSASVFVCGSYPNPSTSSNTNEVIDGKFFPDCRILPVVFINVNVIHESLHRINILSWSTSKEWENSHFDIERSLDGTKTFTKIGEVAGMGWTDEITEYSFEDDKLPLSGGNVFYRLKQVDFNGRFDYSDVTAIRVPNVHFTKGVWRAYPNPNQGEGFQLDLIDISQYQAEPIILRVLSSTLSTNEIKCKNLQELNDSASSIMANAPKGLWIFEIQWGNKVERIKVMKK